MGRKCPSGSGPGRFLRARCYWLALPARRISQLEDSEQALFNLRLAAFLRLIALSSCAAQVIVVSGLASRFASALFLYGLLCCLAYSALGFFRFMFIRPSSE